MDIGGWLRGLGLDRYEPNFADNEIDGEVLGDLTDADLKGIGVGALGHRKKLLKAIGALGGQTTAAAAGSRIPDAERRRMTVMFCDLVGSTALSEKLDPEDLQALIRSYQDLCRANVERFGGHVAKFLGDGVLAYFGYPTAHEDDPQRAVHAGLAIAEGASDPIQVRIGIHTGLVIAGEPSAAGAQDEIVGETPNLAARLEGLAQPGTVAVSAETHSLAAADFSWDDKGSHAVKGITDPVQVFQPIAAATHESRFEARAIGGLTPLVGRETEIAMIMDRWAQARDGEGQVVLLSGEPGIGKSRIGEVIRDRVAPEPHIRLSYQCSPYYTNSAFHPFIARFERIAKFGADWTADQKLDRMEALLSEATDDLTIVAPLYAALLSIETGDRYAPLNMSPQRQKEQTIEALADLTVSLAAKKPLLIFFEDIHWADPTTLEVLEAVIGRVVDSPVLALISYRPEFGSPWNHAHVTAHSLNRLPKRQCADLVAKVTGAKPLPDEVLTQIVAKTDGVPLFVEELTKTVLEAGFLTETSDGYTLEGPLPPLAIPATLQDSLIARLDRLSPVKEVAQIGAVIGREFSHQLIAAVSPLWDNELNDALAQLVSSELVYRRGAPPDATYTFKHALVQDASYETLLKSKRQQIHTDVAKAIEDGFPDVVQNQPELLAHHYTEAGLGEKAIPYWAAAGATALAKAQNPDAILHFQRAIQCVEQARSDLPSPLLANIHGGLAVARIGLTGYGDPSVATALEAAVEHLPTEPSAETMGIEWAVATFHWARGELGKTVHYYERIKISDPVIGSSSLSMVFPAMSRIAEAESNFLQWERSWDPDSIGKSLQLFGQDLGIIALAFRGAAYEPKMGFPDRARDRVAGAIELAQELNHPFTSTVALAMGAWCHASLGMTEDAAAFADECQKLCHDQSLPWWGALAKMINGSGIATFGKIEQGIEDIRDGIETVQIFGGTWTEFYRSYEVQGLAVVGKPKEALEIAIGLEEKIRAGEHLDSLHFLSMGTADAHHQLGNIEKAEAELQSALAAAQEQSVRLYELQAAKLLARIWRSQGKLDEARELLAPIYEWFTEGFDTPDLIEAKALLEELV